MAAAITVTTNLGISGSTAQLPASARTGTIAQVGADVGSDTQDISYTTDAAIAVPASVTGDRHLEVVNLDTTNYVEFSNATGGSFNGGRFAKLYPGLPMVICATGAIYAKANAANVKVQFRCVEA